MLGRILTKLRKSYDRRGALGTARYALQRLAHPLLELTPRRRRERRHRAETDRAFDARYGVDTGGFIQLSQFNLEGDTWRYGAPYGAIDPVEFERVMRPLDIRHEDFTFVDFGSGKGRALLLASLFPFKKIVGVELCPELTQIAKENVRKFRPDDQRCRDIEPVCVDALKYTLPDGPVVCYFYNPFDREIMEHVVARVGESCRANPREVYVLYANPLLGALWERSGRFRTLTCNRDFAIYKAEA
jgi:SAM-dependent methyltransferase